jgi:hypothetical protein
MLSLEVALGAKTHANQMIDIICSVLIAGRYAEIDEAHFMLVADGKVNGPGHGKGQRTGVLAECKHCGAYRRGKDGEFVGGK